MRKLQISKMYYKVISQKCWHTKSMISSSLSEEAAKNLRSNLLDSGYRYATVVIIAEVI